MSSSTRILAALVLLPIVACSPTVPYVGARHDAIYWGEPESGYLGVVQLQIVFSLATGAMCTGTLVAPRVVVTAEHCVEDEEGGPLAPGAITIHTGTTGNLASYDVVDIRHLEPVQLSGGDIAVLIAAEPVDAETYPYSTEWEPHPGDPITLVGYGEREDGGDAGRKYLGDNTVDYVFETYFTTMGEPGCHGDSGGPAFDEGGVLVGVIVNTLGGWNGEDTCASGVSGITRVDAFHELVDQAVDDTWDCDGADAEVCGDGRDNDCNRLIDEACLSLGETCEDGVACASGDCRDLGDGARCTEACTPGGADACGEGAYCDEVACGVGACRLAVAGGGAPGDECAGDTDCAGLSCLDLGDERRCLRPCVAGAACPTGEECTDADGDGCGACWSGSADRRPLGASCARDEECASGSCVDDAYGSVCAQECGDACPEGTACDADGQCVRPPPVDLPTGSPCESGADCASGRCEDVAGTPVCVSECDDSCSEDAHLACVADRCEPDGAITGAACSGNADCANGMCGNFDDYRACTQPCSEDAPCPAGLLCRKTDSGSFCEPLTPPAAAEPEETGGCDCRGAPGPPGAPMSWFAFLFVAALVLVASRLR